MLRNLLFILIYKNLNLYKLNLMPYRIKHISEQSVIGINSGELEENKPVGLSNNRSSIRPYSYIFYLSNLWTDVGTTVQTHSHKGFEILSIVIKGKVEHHYPDLNKSIILNSGDMEYLNSGSGIKHKEIYQKDTQVLQIWLDPNLRKSLGKQPVVKKFESDQFPRRNTPRAIKNYIIGGESKIDLDTKDITIVDSSLGPGFHEFKVSEDRYLTGYLIKGEIEIDGTFYTDDTFFVAKDMTYSFFVPTHARVILIDSPKKPDYKTYLQIKSGS